MSSNGVAPEKRKVTDVVPLLNRLVPVNPMVNHDYMSSDSPPEIHNNGHDEANSGDDMVEVTPDIQMYIGNHFMSDMINGGSATQSEDDSPSVPQIRLKKPSNLFADPNGDVSSESSLLGSRSLNGPTSKSEEATIAGSGAGGAVGEKPYLCRLCGRTAPSGAALFAHLLYPHYAHLWRTEIPHRANQYLCKQCPYTTTKRQHFVQHVAKVHEDLKKKLIALGENIEVLDNLNPKFTNGSTERIVSKVAKFKFSEDFTLDESLGMSAGEYSNMNSPAAPDMESMNHNSSTPISTPTGPNMIPSKLFNSGGLKPEKPLEMSNFGGLIPGRFPKGYKPFVKCRLCGKGWKGKDNFFTHLVSTHFKHLWSTEVPKHADMFHCHVTNCNYQSKYRYNFLFHLAGKHKQLKEKLARDGISLDVLIPIECDEIEPEDLMTPPAGASPTILKTNSLAMQQHFLSNENNMQKFLAATAPPANSGGGGRTPSHGKYSAANSTVRLICRVCKKISFNHTCHRQHVVSKHFQDFWADKSPDQTGLFHCHHCDYQTPNRSVFVIHLAYTHSELKTKLKESGNNPDFADPDVYGKRKYRRSHYDNTQHLVPQAGGVGNPAALVPPSTTISRGRPPKVPKMMNDEEEPIDPLIFAAMPAPIVTMETPDDEEEENPIEATNGEKHKYVCRLCKTQFGRLKSVIEHLALAHFYQVWEDNSPENASFFVPADGPYVCPNCPFTSGARAAFIAHTVTQHDALKSVMSLQYGDKKVEDLYTVSGASSNEDETYDEGDDEEDDIDDDEENAPEDVEDMDDEMDGQNSDLDFPEPAVKMTVGDMAEGLATSNWE